MGAPQALLGRSSGRCLKCFQEMLIFVDFLDFCALVFSGIFGTMISAIGPRGSEIGAIVCVKSRLSGLYD